VKIINPPDGSVAEVPEVSLIHHYRAGWRLLTSDEDEALVNAAAAAPEPKPMSKAQAAKAAKSGSEDK